MFTTSFFLLGVFTFIMVRQFISGFRKWSGRKREGVGGVGRIGKSPRAGFPSQDAHSATALHVSVLPTGLSVLITAWLFWWCWVRKEVLLVRLVKKLEHQHIRMPCWGLETKAKHILVTRSFFSRECLVAENTVFRFELHPDTFWKAVMHKIKLA